MKEMEFGDMKKQLKKEIKRIEKKHKMDTEFVYGGDASSDAGPDVYYNDERGYDAVERAAPARDYEDYYDERLGITEQRKLKRKIIMKKRWNQ